MLNDEEIIDMLEASVEDGPDVWKRERTERLEIEKNYRQKKMPRNCCLGKISELKKLPRN